jgi:hypothetical protein
MNWNWLYKTFETMEKKKIQAKPKLNASTQEALLTKLPQNNENAVIFSIDTGLTTKPAKVQRITVDMPLELYERIKNEVEDNGQTIKGFIVNLVKFYFQKDRV